MAKGGAMFAIGVAILASAVLTFASAGAPEHTTMGIVGSLALAANLVCAALLYQFRNAESNLRSAWLCSRNDAIGNVAVMLVAGGVLISKSRWPDLAVAAVIAGLSLTSAQSVMRQAMVELRARPAALGPHDAA